MTSSRAASATQQEPPMSASADSPDWKSRYEEEAAIVDRVWKALGIRRMDPAGRTIDQIVGQRSEALADLLKLIDAAGLLNLSNGVQLGQTAWYVKMTDATNYARTALEPRQPWEAQP